MMAYLLRRAVGLVFVMVAMTYAVFVLQQVIPADPVRAVAGPNAPEAVVAARRAELALDQPLPVRYGRYLLGLLRGDMGRSIRTNRPVAAEIAALLPATLELVLSGLVLGTLMALLLAVPGVVPGVQVPVRRVLLSGASAPIFLLAILLLLVFWFQLGWLPGDGRMTQRLAVAGPTGFVLLDTLLAGRLDSFADALRHLALPATTLAVSVAVGVGRTLVSSLHSVMRQDYMRTARAIGQSPASALLRHGLRNAAQAPLAMLGLQAGMMFANILVVERIFGWPGLGLYMVQALAIPDLPAVLGVALSFGAIYVVVTLLVDLAQAWADPRLRSP